MIDLQIKAYGKEKNIPGKLFEVLNEQRGGLQNLKQIFGPVVTPADILKHNTGKTA